MFDYVLGLPVHALVIHAVVVLVPLSALVVLAYVARPGWRRALRWPAVAGALVSGGAAYVAAESGERLLVRVSTTRASSTDFELLANHELWGDRAKNVCLVFLLLTLVAVALLRPPTRLPTRPDTRPGAEASRSARSRSLGRRNDTDRAVSGADRGGPLQVVVGALAALAAIAALVVVALAGHAGSQVVWAGLG